MITAITSRIRNDQDAHAGAKLQLAALRSNQNLLSLQPQVYGEAHADQCTRIAASWVIEELPKGITRKT